MDLSKLPIEGSFRLRGREVTRLESFVDASFAFSLTLLWVYEIMGSSFPLFAWHREQRSSALQEVA